VVYFNKDLPFCTFTLVPQMRGLTMFSLRTAKPARNTVLNLFSGVPRYTPLSCDMLRRVNSLTGTYGRPLSFFLRVY